MSTEVSQRPVIFPKNRNGRPARDLVRLGVVHSSQRTNKSVERGPAIGLGESTMPVSTGSESLLATFPSFMSVFGDGIDQHRVQGSKAAPTQAPTRTSDITKKQSHATHVSSPILRRDSTSTFESNESSPTTTISTIESALTDPSPSSSPESPKSQIPLTSLKGLRTNSAPIQETMERKDQFSSSFPNLPGTERSDSPNKKLRNMKNLSVNTSASHRQIPQLAKLSLQSTATVSHGQAFSAPPTPAFIVPSKAPRRKPSTLGLTISTPESNSSIPSSQDRPSSIPQTPSDHHVQTLSLSQNSSSGPLFSPTGAPEGGMQLPPFNNPASTSRFGKAGPPLTISPQSSLDNSIRSPVAKQTLDHVQEETEYDLPLSQEAKSPAYPQGPVCIYDPHVYLYLEPTHIEARQFDVILNVAREVLNPFNNPIAVNIDDEKADQPIQMNKTAGIVNRDSLEPQTANTENILQSAVESLQENDSQSSPNTPKASRPEPEYIHVPWDHNTNVVNDLLKLCEIIDDRVRQNKQVLVHCQCGVSRSASLVVAYGLYKNPQLTVQEAYDVVKNKSRWIGPNMNLIYQLSEFKSKLAKLPANGTQAWHTWRTSGSTWSNTNATPIPNLGTIQTSSILSPPKASSAPSHFDYLSNPAQSQLVDPPASAHLTKASIVSEIPPGPSSAPPNMVWPSDTRLLPDSNVTKSAIGFSVGGNEPRPISMNLEHEIAMSSTSDNQEAIQEKLEPPIGAIAKDLQEIAKDLDHHDTDIASMSSPPPMIDNQEATSDVNVNSVNKSLEELEEQPQPSPPNLPAGFSSLLARRQALQCLPNRQETPRLKTARSVLPISNLATHDDIPSSPSILSPRAAEFTTSPFHRTSAGDLAGSSVFDRGLLNPKASAQDPRSPHQRGEAPILRSISDMI